MPTPNPLRGTRILGIIAFSVAMAFPTLMFWQSVPKDTEVLVWGDKVVEPGDLCFELGPPPVKSGQCRTLATKETRHVDADPVSFVAGALALPAILSTATIVVIRGRRYYGIVEQPAIDTYSLVRGAGIGGYDRLVLTCSVRGLLLQRDGSVPKDYGWRQIMSIQANIDYWWWRDEFDQGELDASSYSDTSFEYILTFDDGNTLPVKGSYQDPQLVPDVAETPEYLFASSAQQWNEQLSAKLVMKARADIAKGRTVAFDDLTISTEGIRHKDRIADWASVAEVRFGGKFLMIDGRDRTSLIRKPLIAIPNLPLLLTLIEDLRRSAPTG